MQRNVVSFQRILDSIDFFSLQALHNNIFALLIHSNSSLLQFAKNDRSFVLSALPNLGSVTMQTLHRSPELVLTQVYPGHLLQAVSSFLETLQHFDASLCRLSIEKLHNEHILKYIDGVIAAANKPCTSSSSWFNKSELLLVLNIVKINRNTNDCNFIDNRTQLQLAFCLLNCMSQELVVELLYLFEEIVFNQKSFSRNTEQQVVAHLQDYKKLYTNAIIAALDAHKVSTARTRKCD